MANPMIMLKNKVQAQKDELERMREDLESKCKEVDEERAAKSAIELEITSISRRLRLIEGEYGHAQSRLDDSERKLEAMLESAEVSENSRRAFESQISMKDDRSLDLDHLVKEAREAANEAERKLCEASRKLKMLSGDLERAEERADAAELKAQTMEEDLTEMTNMLKNKQLSEGESSERGDVYENTVREMASQLKEVENRTFENERSCIKLQREVKRLEDEIAHAEKVKESIKMEMESYFHEVEAL